MSSRLVLSRSWAEAQGARATAIKYICPGCLTTRLSRSLSSSSRLSRNNPQSGGDSVPPATTKHYTKNSKAKGSPRTRRIFSLVQPTGIPHLGNYLGALRTWKDFQDEKDAPGHQRRNHTLIYGIADLHSLTSKQDPDERREHIYQTFASLLAIGLDPRKSTLFLQSDIPAHSELMWVLSNVASTGYLSRMTQWKEKIGLENPQSSSRSPETLDEKSQEKLKLGLFSYPVLQAADILLYEPDTIPVGEDQAQHVEFTRQLARSFNSTYCRGKDPVLTIPELLLSPAKRVMSLQDPTKKMSKSDPDPMSRVLITDTPENIQLKFKKAKTDSIPGPITYSHVERPGVSNLIDIYKHITRNPKNQETIVAEHQDLTLGALKAMVSDAVIKELQGVRERYLALIDENNNEVNIAMLQGRSTSMARAGTLVSKVRNAVGLYFPDRSMRRQKGNEMNATRQTEEKTMEGDDQNKASIEQESQST